MGIQSDTASAQVFRENAEYGLVASRKGLPARVGKDRLIKLCSALREELPLALAAVFPAAARALLAQAANQEELIDLALLAAGLLALIGRKLPLPKIRNDFSLSPRLCIARLLLPARSLKLVSSCKQGGPALPARRISERSHVKFRAGYFGRRLFQSLPSARIDFRFERIDLCVYLGNLGRQCL